MKLIRREGTGKLFILLFEQGKEVDLVFSTYEKLNSHFECLLIEAAPTNPNNWSSERDSLLSTLQEQRVRMASFLSFGATGSLLQDLALSQPKLIRNLTLVDGSTRPRPSRFIKILDRLERWLPMGLPFRNSVGGFDARSLLQRIRCPVLIISTTRAAKYLLYQASVFADSFPTAWKHVLGPDDEAGELSRLLLDFQEIPAKCPQKNIGRIASGG